jgi:ubiquinone biosynthesis protein
MRVIRPESRDPPTKALLLSARTGSVLIPGVTPYDVFGYNLLMISAMVGLRLLYLIFRRR